MIDSCVAEIFYLRIHVISREFVSTLFGRNSSLAMLYCFWS